MTFLLSKTSSNCALKHFLYLYKRKHLQHLLFGSYTCKPLNLVEAEAVVVEQRSLVCVLSRLPSDIRALISICEQDLESPDRQLLLKINGAMLEGLSQSAAYTTSILTLTSEAFISVALWSCFVYDTVYHILYIYCCVYLLSLLISKC